MAVKQYKKGVDTKLAENFQSLEFDCNGVGCCTTTLIDEKLVEYLQNIRDHFQKPVHLTAYRCKVHNARTPNAAPNSRHTFGQAADFHIDGVPCTEIAKYAESIGVKGIGLYDDFVHIDTRENKSFWYSHAQHYRSTFGGSSVGNGYPPVQFVKDVQEAIGAAVDGIAGPETMGKAVTLSTKVNAQHKAVEVIQKRLKDLGYAEVGDADGIAGPKFTSAVAHFQQDNGCDVDGVIGPKTWAKLLGV